jgi:hypothetical protein
MLIQVAAIIGIFNKKNLKLGTGKRKAISTSPNRKLSIAGSIKDLVICTPIVVTLNIKRTDNRLCPIAIGYPL